LEELYGPEVIEKWRTNWCQVPKVAGKEDTTYLDTTIRTSDGDEIPIRLTGTTLLEAGEMMGCVTFFQDLRDIRRLEKQLVQSERMAAIGQTSATIAHAIKNIVGGLKGGMFVVNKGFELSNQDYLQDGWDMVQRNVTKISSLAMDLLTYSKERRPEYRLAQVNEVAGEVVDLMKARAEEFKVNLILDATDGLEPVEMDLSGIHQCLVNLVSNAIDACWPEICGHERGQVVVRTCRHPDWAVCVEVEDNGCGIEESNQEKIFTTFFSTKGADGTGLGLMNAQKIAREHQGCMEVESVPNKGSIFRLLLPSGPSEEQEDGSESDPGEGAESKSPSAGA
jgi:signal transduction histidine kinase